jgi:hypothetical protein
MTPIAGPAYVATVLAFYIALPDTPNRASSYDKRVADALFQRGVPIQAVESALLLGFLRRHNRPGALLPLPPVRSLAYFSPVIDEILRQPLPPTYLEYLRSKANRLIRLDVQHSKLSNDRSHARCHSRDWPRTPACGARADRACWAAARRGSSVPTSLPSIDRGNGCTHG